MRGGVTATFLSNKQLPVDSRGDKLVTGETDILKEGDTYYIYVNNWGGCDTVDCCPSPGGCASCCYVPSTPQYTDNCVFRNNHSVVAYKTKDFSTFDYIGVVLSLSDRPGGIEFRPHIVKPRAGHYVMWFEDRPKPIVSSGYAVAISSSPEGPFHTVRANVSVTGIVPGDFDVLVSNGTCWFVQTTTNDPSQRQGFAIVALSESCTEPAAKTKPTLFFTPKPSEGPVFFERQGQFYILAGTTCCACRGGSSIYAFSSSSPTGPWNFLGDIGRNESTIFDPHSPYNYITRSQASTVFEFKESFLWLGNQWTTGKRNSSLVYWSKLSFFQDGAATKIRNFVWTDGVEL